ncbi:hypothetical protein KSP39_PZI016635 [Platanthera zijinensis]|uniref:Uncharacterized protein n=1 Tax=Platanthera zijinensis TaxID=2320716 RepID=A0AAP0B6W4_9ASPA
MAPLFQSPAAAVAALLLLSFLSISSTSSDGTVALQLQYPRRSLISSIGDQEDLDSPIPKSKSTAKKKSPVSESMEIKNSTKALKPKKTNSTISSSSSSSSSPNISALTAKSKLNKTLSAGIKAKLNKTLSAIPAPPKLNLNKTSILISKPLKPIKILKSNSTKIRQLKPPNPPSKTQKKLEAEDPPSAKTQSTPKPKSKPPLPIKIVQEDDLISEFRDLPSRLQSAFIPDLHKLSTTSKLYLSKTHREIAAGMKPFVGKKYAPSIASAALLILPLFLVTALFRHLIRAGSSASLHRAVLFVQAYLAIYFATLSLTAVATGLEPLRFFYAASPAAYAWTQAVQTFGYVVYLVVQLIALVVAFSAGDGEGSSGKAVSMAQMLLGLAVGMHYYITVLHRAVAGEAPRANWKVHGIYATCFVVICGLGRADRRKKAYVLYSGGDADDKKN